MIFCTNLLQKKKVAYYLEPFYLTFGDFTAFFALSLKHKIKNYFQGQVNPVYDVRIVIFIFYLWIRYNFPFIFLATSISFFPFSDLMSKTIIVSPAWLNALYNSHESPKPKTVFFFFCFKILYCYYFLFGFILYYKSQVNIPINVVVLACIYTTWVAVTVYSILSSWSQSDLVI